MCDFEAGADQQVLGLEAKQITHRKLVDKAFRSTVWVSDVIDQFDSIDLSMTIETHHPVAARNPSTVCRGEVRLVFRLLASWTSENSSEGLKRSRMRIPSSTKCRRISARHVSWSSMVNKY